MMIYPDWLMQIDPVIGTIGKGTIEIEPGWQLISIPIKNGFWDKVSHKLIHDATIATIKNYLMDQIEDILAKPVNEVISVANTYIGDNQFFYNYVPGVTAENNSNNFKSYKEWDND